MRRKWGSVLLGLVTVGSILPGSAAGAIRESRPAVPLRGTTTFSSSELGHIRFSLSKKVNIQRDFDFDATGSGRVFGFAFWEAGGESGWSAGVEYVQLGLCDTRSCSTKSSGGFAFVTGSYLPAGEYDLYVIADGAPVEVTFEVDTLRGRATYRPSATDDAEIRTLPTTIDSSDGAQMYSAGRFTELPESDWSFMGLWALNGNDLATAYGSCAYSSEFASTPLAEAAFLPGCPTSDGFEFVNEGPNGGTVLTVSHHGGPEGVGGWFTSGSAHARYGAVAFWFDI